MSRKTRLFAHRGGGGEVLENSDAAVAYTASLSGFILETDVRLSADGQVVLSHDSDSARVWGSDLVISRARYRGQLDQLRGDQGERMALLGDVLGAYPSLRVNIEPKDDRVVAPLIGLIDRHGAWDRVVFGCFSTRRLARIRRLGKGRARTSLSPGGVARMVAASQVGRVPALAAGVVAAQVPPSYFGVPVTTRRFVATCHRAGIEVHVWTLNQAQQMRRLIKLGVDGIMTDYPLVLRQVVAGEE